MMAGIATSFTLLLLLLLLLAAASVTATAPSTSSASNDVDVDGALAVQSEIDSELIPQLMMLARQVPGWTERRCPYYPGCWPPLILEAINELHLSPNLPEEDDGEDGAAPSRLLRFRAAIFAIDSFARISGDAAERLYCDCYTRLQAMRTQDAARFEAVVGACTALLPAAFSATAQPVAARLLDRVAGALHAARADDKDEYDSDEEIAKFRPKSAKTQQHKKEKAKDDDDPRHVADTGIMVAAGTVVLARCGGLRPDPEQCLRRLDAIAPAAACASSSSTAAAPKRRGGSGLFIGVPPFQMTTRMLLHAATTYLDRNESVRDRYTAAAAAVPRSVQQLALAYGLHAALLSGTYTTSGASDLLLDVVARRIPVYRLAALLRLQRDRTGRGVVQARAWIAMYESPARATRYVASVLSKLAEALTTATDAADLEQLAMPKSELGPGPGPLRPLPTASSCWWVVLACCCCCSPCGGSTSWDLHRSLRDPISYHDLLDVLCRISPDSALE